MYLVSACLAGFNCRYNASNCFHEKIRELVNAGKAFPACPEQLAGLPTPRESCQICVASNGTRQVISESGKNLSEEFGLGAKHTLALCKVLGIQKAILKSHSPSCGCGFVYDGTFTGKIQPSGDGITAELLKKNGIISENRSGTS